MKNKRLSFIVLIIFLSGCVQTKIVDELDLISAVGIDLEDDKIHLTALYNHYTPDKKIENKLLTISIGTHEDILDHLDREASKPVMFGDIDVVILNSKVAEAGVFQIVDTLQRTADIGARLYLALTEEPSKNLLTGNYEAKGNGQYIFKLIDHNVKFRDIPKTNLHLFASDFFQKGKGAYLPILKKLDKEKLEITGLGLFDKGKLVHKLTGNQMFYFKLIVDKHIKSSMNVKVGKQNAVLHDIKTKTSIITDYDSLTVHIHYNVKGIVKRYSGKKVDPKTIEKIKSSAKKKMEKETLSLLTQFQEMKIDPVGIERKFRQQHRDFDEKKWRDQYQNVKYKFHSKVTIMESGTVE